MSPRSHTQPRIRQTEGGAAAGPPLEMDVILSDITQRRKNGYRTADIIDQKQAPPYGQHEVKERIREALGSCEEDTW